MRRRIRRPERQLRASSCLSDKGPGGDRPEQSVQSNREGTYRRLSTVAPRCAVQPGFGAASRKSSLIDERSIVEIDRREFILFGPVVLAVLPFRLVAAVEQQMHVAHQIAGIEIFRIDPRR